MAVRRKVLVVEDEEVSSSFLKEVLCGTGYDVLTAATGKQAEAMANSHCPDVVLLDLGLPDTDGMNVLKSLRKWSDRPVIVISARCNDEDKVFALEAGADDYLSKPYSTAELLARIKVALRHFNSEGTNRSMTKNGRFTVGELAIDYDKCRVYIKGRDAKLTQNEFKMMALLGKYAGRVLTYDFMIKEMWGPNAKNDNQILRVNMANIRRKLDEDPSSPRYIFTETGVGYRLAEK